MLIASLPLVGRVDRKLFGLRLALSPVHRISFMFRPFYTRRNLGRTIRGDASPNLPRISGRSNPAGGTYLCTPKHTAI